MAAPATEDKTSQLDEIVVTAQKDELAKKTPAVVETRTAEDLKRVNAVESQDLLKQMPNVYVRDLNTGSTASRLTIRANPPVSQARSLVLVDGARISNFIGTSHSDGPRWELTAPEEIERIDMIYGPFSAAYSGNSMGGTAIITTKMPTKREFSLETGGSIQKDSVFKKNENLKGINASLGYGDKKGNLAYSILYKRQEADTQPISFVNVKDSDGKTPVGKPVTGATPFIDNNNLLNYNLGSAGAGTTTNDTAKIKLAYDLDSFSRIKLSVAYSGIEREADSPDSYVIDSSGQRVYSGKIDINGKSFDAKSSTYKYSESATRDVLYALSYTHKPTDGLKFDLDLSYYDILEDSSNNSKELPHTTAIVPGVLTDSDGGWYTADFKIGRDIKWMGNHGLNLGYHFDQYFVENETWDGANWKSYSSRTKLTSRDEGKTNTNAIFAEDTWDVNNQWAFYLGARCEWWKGFDGSRSRDTDSGTRAISELPDRHDKSLSPKLAATFKPAEDWSIRYSLARATRFPMIGEMYYGVINPTTGVLNVSNPNLKPESAIANDLTITKNFGWNTTLRLSFYQSDVTDAIYKQLNDDTKQTTYENVDKVRTRGVELGLDTRNLIIQGLDLNASVAWSDPKIKRNSTHKNSDNNKFPGVATRRAKLGVDYAPNERWFIGMSADYASKPYNTLENIERRCSSSCYGGIDGYLVFNARTGYKITPQVTASIGVDNLTDEIYFDGHPYQRRTFFFNLKYVFNES